MSAPRKCTQNIKYSESSEEEGNISSDGESFSSDISSYSSSSAETLFEEVKKWPVESMRGLYEVEEGQFKAKVIWEG
jgi:hypothetical protein